MSGQNHSDTYLRDVIYALLLHFKLSFFFAVSLHVGDLADLLYIVNDVQSVDGATLQMVSRPVVPFIFAHASSSLPLTFFSTP